MTQYKTKVLFYDSEKAMPTLIVGMIWLIAFEGVCMTPEEFRGVKASYTKPK